MADYASLIRPTHSLAGKRDGLDAVAVGVDDEGGIIFHAIVRTQARRAVRMAPGAERCGMKRIDIAGCLGTKANVGAALGRDLRHAGTQVDPEFRVGFAEADGCWTGDEP